MKLYYAPGACSLASHIALNEAGIAYETEKVDLETKKTASGADYRAISAKGSVPALALDDGGVLTESAVVLQFIADRNPGSGLAPAHGTFARYRFAEWLNYIATEIHKGFGPLWSSANPDDVKQRAKDALFQRFDYVGKRLASTPFLMGDDFTAADAYLYTILRWTAPLKIDVARWPSLAQFMTRVAARPEVRKALEAEGLPA
jgi:glutathione S-transferase